MSAPIEVELVRLDDCPHWRQADARLREAMRRSGLDPTRLRYQVVHTVDAPASFPGSPTILVDGRDAFPAPAPVGPTCRRYPTQQGIEGAPSLEQLVEALARRPPEPAPEGQPR